MTDNDWEQFVARCQKPDYRTVGNWYARRVARPLALHVTRVVLPTGISAHAVTGWAWFAGLAGVVALAVGSVSAWWLAAGLLQLTYLLDHVDGQIARYRRTASLDGIALDYWMHHTLNLLVPIGMGHGWSVQTGSWVGLWLGLAWGLGALVQSVEHDVRCKAIVARLKRLHGALHVIGGRGGRPTPAAAWPRAWRRRLARASRLLGQWHIVIQSVALLALLQSFCSEPQAIVAVYLALLALVNVGLAWRAVTDSLTKQAAEVEFAAWYQPPGEHLLVERGGWWYVEPIDASTPTPAPADSTMRSS